MRINRQTYEEFFLLYNDGELDHEEKMAVEEFIRENPDLEQELILLQNTVLIPDETLVFENKEVLYRHERKIRAISWYRIAVAAILLIAFGITGWLYLDEKKPLHEQTVASYDKLLKNEEDIERVQPSVEPAPQHISTPSESIDKNPPAKRVFAVSQQETVKAGTLKTFQAKNEPAVNNNSSSPELSERELAELEPEQVHEYEKEEIDVAVAARDLTTDLPVIAVHSENSDDATDAQLETLRYVEEEDNNTIYFANTSLPKKSKLRVVFRKATRMLDRVTSLQ